jgi:hypothetical protein
MGFQVFRPQSPPAAVPRSATGATLPRLARWLRRGVGALCLGLAFVAGGALALAVRHGSPWSDTSVTLPWDALAPLAIAGDAGLHALGWGAYAVIVGLASVGALLVVRAPRGGAFGWLALGWGVTFGILGACLVGARMGPPLAATGFGSGGLLGGLLTQQWLAGWPPGAAAGLGYGLLGLGGGLLLPWPRRRPVAPPAGLDPDPAGGLEPEPATAVDDRPGPPEDGPGTAAPRLLPESADERGARDPIPRAPEREPASEDP